MLLVWERRPRGSVALRKLNSCYALSVMVMRAATTAAATAGIHAAGGTIGL